MPKVRTPYWSWAEDATTVPPEHPGEKWRYPNDLNEEYRVMSRKDADSVMASRSARSSKGPKASDLFPNEPDDRGLRGTMALEGEGKPPAKEGEKKSAAGSVKKKGKSDGALNGGGSIVDFLKGVGRKAGVGDNLSSFDMRKHIFETYDIGQDDEEYTGSAKQNMHLLKSLKKEYVDAPDDLLSELTSAVKKLGKKGPEDPTEGEDDDLKEQNGYDIDPIDIDSGTWDEYAAKIKKKGGGPTFAEYKRGKAANLLT